MTVSVSELLVERARALLARGEPEEWRSEDGTVRVLGPLDRPYEGLFLKTFDGPNADARLTAYLDSRKAGVASIFRPITVLSRELGQPCVVVERIAGKTESNGK